MKKLILFLSIISCFANYGQKKYPKNYFRSPLDIPIILSGTFGELRNNHFHSGLDIKTQRKNGLNVYATADGYVSRIKVALFGYGKVIYISHPNGYTTVYAHLSKFGDGIESYVKNIQYKKESYETGNIYPKPNEIVVKKGQVIGYSGSTGGFVSPHLHYEIRDTKTEKIINPMHFGTMPKDTIAPVFRTLLAYPLTVSSRIYNGNKKIVIPFKKINQKTYRTDEILANGKIGFGINVYDRLNDALNKNGVYSIEMEVNGKQVYHHNLETFSFSESKFINLLIDYPHYATYKSRIQKTHKVEENRLNIYQNLVENGVLNIKSGLNYTVKIIAKDFIGNSSSIIIPIKGVKNNAIFKKEKDTTAYRIEKNTFCKFSEENVTVAFPKNTFYQDLYLDFEVKKGIAKIHKPKIPLHKKFTLTFNTSKYSEVEKQQGYIAYIKSKKQSYYQATKKKDSTFYTTSKTLGKYTIKFDSIKPKVRLYNFKDGQWVSKNKFLKVKISDTDSGIASYYATIDGEWILMEYDLKKKLLTYNFKDKKLVGNKHIFEIVVEDNVGNTNTLSATFYKKQNP